MQPPTDDLSVQKEVAVDRELMDERQVLRDGVDAVATSAWTLVGRYGAPLSHIVPASWW
jgi:hypothetical protein